MSDVRIVQGDCLDVFRGLRGLGAIVADPPAGIGFCGRKWDMLPSTERRDSLAREDAFSEYWGERLDVARSACVDNAVALIWAMPRTADLTMRAIRLGGWHIQDVIVHVFGQGWPKNKAALKPAAEHWILARKGSPELGIDDCRVARGNADWPEGGRPGGHTAKPGALKIGGAPPGNGIRCNALGSYPTNFVMSHAEGCRRAGMRRVRGSAPASGPTLTGPSRSTARGTFNGIGATPSYGLDGAETLDAWACVAACDCGEAWLAMAGGPAPVCTCGRAGWWACPVAELDAQSGERPSGGRTGLRGRSTGTGSAAFHRDSQIGKPLSSSPPSTGGGSRYFPTLIYYGKAPPGERHAGCEDLYWRVDKKDPFGFVQITREEWEALPERERAHGNTHPTIKRIALVRWLHKLSAPRGPIGDLAGGSGSGAIAALLDGYDWIGAEICPQAITIAEARLAFWRSLSPAARARFTATAELPQRVEAPPNQPSLFGGSL